jgi:replication factor A1
MKIKDISSPMGNVELVGKIVEIGEERQVMTKYGRRRVADAVLEDDTGRIKMTLWGEQIDSVKEGDKVEISGGFVTEFRDELQLNVPRRGKIVVVK